ncbi:uncharacterized protein LOC131077646 [Cryptomeria japonica]|uniref:uncharacterized protein LOC131077646 n=1 Tax=Cryptomeria japonica TaxID=3369 RepID=UPI0027DA88AF|nr:uncharacterized protein LOC131077646 [Cryptomeria japonica]
MKTLDKAQLWKVLTDKISVMGNDKIVVVGDFNALLDLEEKQGGLRMPNKVMEDFRDFVNQNHLMDVTPKNGTFTWTNRRANFAHISERLDRHFIGEAWLESSFQVEAFILPISVSDHFPVELKLSEAPIKGRMSNDSYHREVALKQELAEILLREECFWRDKSRELWIREGNANMKFFHASVKGNRIKNRISEIADQDGNRHSTPDAIEEVAITFFRNLLGEAGEKTLIIY